MEEQWKKKMYWRYFKTFQVYSSFEKTLTFSNYFLYFKTFQVYSSSEDTKDSIIEKLQFQNFSSL